VSDYILTVPEEIYQRARRIADESALPVAEVLIDYLRTLHSPSPALPPEEEAELDALSRLSDDALWTIALDALPQSVQSEMELLMQRNSLGAIDDADQLHLADLVERNQRLMLRKSEAAALLTRRGFDVKSLLSGQRG